MNLRSISRTIQSAHVALEELADGSPTLFNDGNRPVHLVELIETVQDFAQFIGDHAGKDLTDLNDRDVQKVAEHLFGSIWQEEHDGAY